MGSRVCALTLLIEPMNRSGSTVSHTNWMIRLIGIDAPLLPLPVPMLVGDDAAAGNDGDEDEVIVAIMEIAVVRSVADQYP